MLKQNLSLNLQDKLNTLEAKDDFKLQNIDIDKLIPSTKNIYGIRDIDELASDIKENGLYHNLLVRSRNDGTFEIISGERRYHALKKLGLKKAPCQVRDLDDVDSEILLIQANAKTRELTHTEKMKQIEKLEELYKYKRQTGEKLDGKTRDLIGKDLGLSGVQVGRYQKINKELIPEIKELLDKNKISMSKADIIAAMDTDAQKAMLEILKTNMDLTREEIQQIKDTYKQQLNIFQKEKEEETLKLEEEKKKIYKLREDFNREVKELEEKQKNSSKVDQVNNKNPNLEEIKYNTELLILLKNFRAASSNVLIKIVNKEKNTAISKENKQLIDSIMNGNIKVINESL